MYDLVNSYCICNSIEYSGVGVSKRSGGNQAVELQVHPTRCTKIMETAGRYHPGPTRPAHHGSCFGKTALSGSAATRRGVVCGSTRHTHSHRQSLWSVGLKQGGRRYPRRPQLSPRYTCTRLPQGLLIRQISSRCRPRLPAKSLFRCREPRDRPRRGAPPLCNHGTCKNP